MEKFGGLISKTFNFKLGSLNVAPTYWQAVAIVALLFLLVWTLARMRYLYVHWSLGKPSLAFIFWGFLMALIMEGFLIIGGRTMFTEILGWKDAPKPISTVLEKSRSKLITVLGVTEEVPQSMASEMVNYQSVVESFIQLDDEDKKATRDFICEEGN